MQFAFIYDGQGSQKPGMGADLYEKYPVFHDALDAMDPTGKYRELCFNGTEEQLADTRNTQPCMVAVELALTALLESVGIKPSMTYGLSLGEYAALSAAGTMDPKTAVDLVAFRGNAMAEAAKGYDCGMAAVLALDAQKLEQACGSAKDAGYVAITNYNCPGQIVISGEKAAVDKACEAAKELGAKRCIPLPVSGPFHTKLMEPAGQAIAAKLEGFEFGSMDVPVLFNTTAKPLEEGSTIASMLVAQVQNPVHFDGCVETMVQSGITATIELGAGKSLTKFVKKIDKSVQTYAVYDVKSFESVRDGLAGLA